MTNIMFLLLNDKNKINIEFKIILMFLFNYHSNLKKMNLVLLLIYNIFKNIFFLLN